MRKSYSLIVDREDDYMVRAKADLANAIIKVKYLENHKVFVCHHNNLRDKRYRKNDQLHLNEFGTSRLANNLKYKIAESLDISVVKKQRIADNRYNDRNNYSNYSNYDRRQRSDDFNINNRINRYDEYQYNR